MGQGGQGAQADRQLRPNPAGHPTARRPRFPTRGTSGGRRRIPSLTGRRKRPFFMSAILRAAYALAATISGSYHMQLLGACAQQAMVFAVPQTSQTCLPPAAVRNMHLYLRIRRHRAAPVHASLPPHCHGQCAEDVWTWPQAAAASAGVGCGLVKMLGSAWNMSRPKRWPDR